MSIDYEKLGRIVYERCGEDGTRNLFGDGCICGKTQDIQFNVSEWMQISGFPHYEAAASMARCWRFGRKYSTAWPSNDCMEFVKDHNDALRLIPRLFHDVGGAALHAVLGVAFEDCGLAYIVMVAKELKVPNDRIKKLTTNDESES